MSLILMGSTSGSITLSEPAVAGSNTINLPAATGTAMVSGNMPAFSAYLNTAQSVSNNTFTKLQAGTEEFDTSSSYDASTNYRFTPTVAGYYKVSGCIAFNATSGINSNTLCTIYKNGSRFKDGNLSGTGSAGTLFYSVVSALVYLNGSTDYVELWGLLGGTGTLTFSVNSGTNSYFQAVMIRGA